MNAVLGTPSALAEALDLDGRLAAAFAGCAGSALSDHAGTINYAELGERVSQVASAIIDLGLPPGSTVALAASKMVDTVVALLALIRAGHCVSVLEPGLSADAVAERVERFGIGAVIADDVNLARLESRLGDRVRLLSAVVHGAGARRSLSAHQPDAAALLLVTSGSTGVPKGVRLHRRHLLAHADGLIAHSRLGPGDRLLHLMPLHHTNGINNQILAPLLAGAEIVLIERFDARQVPEQIDRYQPTIVTGVPTMYLRVLEHLEPGRRWPGLRMLRCGSAPLTVAQQRQIEAAFGVPLVVSYGLSEATCTTTMNPPDRPREGTVGTVLARQQVRIVMPGTTCEAPVGEEGEICIGGPTVMSGYVGSDDPNPVNDGWLHTGDLGRLDSEGYLTVTGRIKDVIIRGGENLAPNAIEAALSTHPLVSDAVVVAATHHDLGEVPVAFIVPADPARPPEPEDIREHVCRALSRVYTPERVLIVPALPTNAVGKVDKKRLLDELAAE